MCPIRDTYNKREYRRVLAFCWMQPEVVDSVFIREHFALAVRRAVLLGDEDFQQ